jgi:hypothetical protein
MVTVLAAAYSVPAARGQALVVSVRSVDALLADARYLIGLAGAEEQVSQLDAFIKGALASKEQTGLDTGRPFGLYAHWPKGWVAKSFAPVPIVAFVPVADEKKLLGLLAGFGLKAKKTEGGIYRLDATGTPLFFRFAERHAFVALDPILLRDPLSDPAALIPAAAKSSLVFACFRIDRIPKEEKDLLEKKLFAGLTQVEAGGPKQLEGEMEAQFQAQMRDLLKPWTIPLRQGKEISIRLDVDRKRHHLTVDVVFLPLPGSALAAGIKALDGGRSMFADLARTAKLSVFYRMGVLGRPAAPTPVRRDPSAVSPSHMLVTGVPSELFEELESFVEPRHRVQIRRVIKVLVGPLARLDAFDLGVALQARPGGWTWTGGVHVVGGRKMEGLLRDFLKDLPEADRKAFHLRWSHASHAGTRIHKGRLPLDGGKVELARTIYLAIRENVVLLSTGSEVSRRSFAEEADTPALDAIKEALDTIDRPSSSTGPLFQADIAPGWVASIFHLITDDFRGKRIPLSWHDMIASGSLNSEEGRRMGNGVPAQVVRTLGAANLDKIRATLSIRAGETLHLHFDLHTHALKLVPLAGKIFSVGAGRATKDTKDTRK